MSLDTLGNFSVVKYCVLWGPHPAIKNCKNYKYVLHTTFTLVIASTYLYSKQYLAAYCIKIHYFSFLQFLKGRYSINFLE